MQPQDVADLVEQVKPVLAGRPPELQGATLADLLALWLAGHPPSMREQLLALHVDTVRLLVPINERAIFGPAGHPEKPQ